jgi:hypothetical protein
MGDAKRIIIKPIAAKDANKIIKAIHYSGKVVNNSQLHLGVFLDGKCGGALQFGPSLDKRHLISLVSGTLWNEFIELNRLALADWLPRNGESRSISLALKFIKKNYPWIKWVVSFSDGTQCGDGTIYRASGFVLTQIKTNSAIWAAPSGEKFTDIGLRTGAKERSRAFNIINKTTYTKGSNILDSGSASMSRYIKAGFKPLVGFQLRYIYFLDTSVREKLMVPILPFSEIERLGAGMYKGQPKKSVSSIDGDATGNQPEEGGSSPTDTLQPSNPEAPKGDRP